MTTYAVTGASGPFGRLAVIALLEAGVAAGDVVAIARTPEKASDLAEKGVHVRRADYSAPETLATALAGVDRLLLVSGSEVGQRIGQHGNVIDAAKGAGVARIVYTSLLRADSSSLSLAPEHKATEELLAASGVAFAAARNGWYLENYTGQVDQYVAAGEIVAAAGEGRVAAAPRADYAAAAVALLLGEQTGVFELGGTSFSYAELAAAVTRASGTPVSYRAVSTDDLVAHLRGVGLDEGTASFVAALDAGTATGELDTDSGDLETLLGRPAGTLDGVLAVRV